MQIEWSHILSVTIGFAISLVLKILLDFKIAVWLVKRLHKVSLRSFFRTKYYDISGFWEQTWDFSDTETTYQNETDRKSLLEVKQLGKYIYAEFTSKDKTYGVFGKIKESNFITGDWFDINDSLGYYGSFQLKIIDKVEMQGKWIGHSKRKNTINGDKWLWTKL